MKSDDRTQELIAERDVARFGKKLGKIMHLVSYPFLAFTAFQWYTNKANLEPKNTLNQLASSYQHFLKHNPQTAEVLGYIALIGGVAGVVAAASGGYHWICDKLEKKIR